MRYYRYQHSNLTLYLLTVLVCCLVRKNWTATAQRKLLAQLPSRKFIPDLSPMAPVSLEDSLNHGPTYRSPTHIGGGQQWIGELQLHLLPPVSVGENWEEPAVTFRRTGWFWEITCLKFETSGGFSTLSYKDELVDFEKEPGWSSELWLHDNLVPWVTKMNRWVWEMTRLNKTSQNLSSVLEEYREYTSN